MVIINFIFSRRAKDSKYPIYQFAFLLYELIFGATVAENGYLYIYIYIYIYIYFTINIFGFIEKIHINVGNVNFIFH